MLTSLSNTFIGLFSNLARLGIILLGTVFCISIFSLVFMDEIFWLFPKKVSTLAVSQAVSNGSPDYHLYKEQMTSRAQELIESRKCKLIHFEKPDGWRQARSPDEHIYWVNCYYESYVLSLDRALVAKNMAKKRAQQQEQQQWLDEINLAIFNSSEDHYLFGDQMTSRAQQLISSNRCKLSDFELSDNPSSDGAGWKRATNYGEGVYYVRCGGDHQFLWLDDSSILIGRHLEEIELQKQQVELQKQQEILLVKQSRELLHKIDSAISKSSKDHYVHGKQMSDRAFELIKAGQCKLSNFEKSDNLSLGGGGWKKVSFLGLDENMYSVACGNNEYILTIK